jgi:phage terminase Nu1 subunit (DNA packaging protein)
MKKATKPAAAGVSGAALARLYGVHERTIHKLADDGILVRVDRGLYDQDASTMNYIRHLRDVAGRRADSSDARDAHARYKLAQAAKAEMELQEKAGKLLDADATEAEISRHVLAFRQMLLSGIPNQIFFDVPTLSPRDRETIKTVCRTALWDLALGRIYAVLSSDSGRRCDGCGGVIPKFVENEEQRKAHEHMVYREERAAVLGTERHYEHDNQGDNNE